MPETLTSVTHVVEPQHTAHSVGSGDLEVLGTPVVVAWCEEATCAALTLTDGQTSVGTRVEIEHLAASAVGTEVTAVAEVDLLEGRRARFIVTATDAGGTVLARGVVERAIVDREQFLARL